MSDKWDILINKKFDVAPKYQPIEITSHKIISVKEMLPNHLGESSIVISTITIPSLLNGSALIETSRQTSAKIVLIGESNVGKSCLAMRLAQDDYQEQGSTHGMKIWRMKPEQLDKEAIAPEGEQREIVIWDMGGQEEYRLVHQLFIHDTTLALILLDPSRGQTAFDEVEGWNVRLEKQNRKATKLLVGTKLDEESRIVDQARVNKLLEECRAAAYYSTSAKNSRGIEELRQAIAKAIDWEALSQTSRPKLFQDIRNEIARLQQVGEIAVLYDKLAEQIKAQEGDNYDAEAVKTVVDQLAVQGEIASTRLATGQRVLVLQIGELEKYAGSIIVEARNNARGVPAIDTRLIERLTFPGIKAEERLEPFKERVVVECVTQLLIEHGICLSHEGLLIFPTLLLANNNSESEEISHTISLYYDFSGAIDNIYSALVVRLALSEKFGRVRLHEDRAEYEQSRQGICGIRKKANKKGTAHIDLYFSSDIADDIRDLFTLFVEDHLRHDGVSITEILEMICACGYIFQGTVLKKRLSDGFTDIGCPECDMRNHINQGVKELKEMKPGITNELLALKTIVENRSKRVAEEVTKTIEAAHKHMKKETPIRILHLSDLHIPEGDDPLSRLLPLSRDLEDPEEGLGIEQLDYLVISGDLTNKATPAEFEKAYQFISKLIERFKLSAERCIIVPGNHDMSWAEQVYEFKSKSAVKVETLSAGTYLEEARGYLIRNAERYPLRFNNFGKFYHSLIQKPYPLTFEEQCESILFTDSGIQFLTMNSSWEIDEFFPDRSSVNHSALVRGIDKADQQVKRAKEVNTLPQDAQILRIAVWHHPVTGNEKIENDAFLEQLRKADVKVCLHGHVHEERADIIGYWHPTRQIRIIGGGSFGAPTAARPESVPRLYNLLEINRDLSTIKVHTRCLRKQDGAWQGWAVWPGSTKHEQRSFYEIPTGLMKRTEKAVDRSADLTPAVTVAGSSIASKREINNYLIEQLNRLMVAHFDEFILRLSIDRSVIPPSPAAQAGRTNALLEWASSSTGIGLDALKIELDEFLKSKKR